jgi:hypothetical protein
MTSSRSLLSRRRQAEILSVGGNKRWDGLAEPAAARPSVAFYPLNSWALPAESGLQASLGVRLLNDTLGAIPRKNSRADCCKSRQRFANARANKAPL